MSYLQNKRRKEKLLEILKEVVAYSLIFSIIAIAYFQYQLVQLVERVMSADQSADKVENYQPMIDPCTLAFVDCAEASEPEPVAVNVQAEALREYLISKGGVELAEHAEEILKLDNWQLAVAIAWKETHFCTRGVGASSNNCGGIKSWKTENTFKTYETVLDSVWDINYLLNKPRFKDMSVKQLASTYCVDEANGGGECPNWADIVNSIKAELDFANVRT